MNYILNSKYNKSVKELAVEDRPRERIINNGAMFVSDLELVMALLGKGTHGISLEVLSQNVLERISLSNGMPVDFSSIRGVGQAKAALLSASLELGRRYNLYHKRCIRTSSDAFESIKHYADRSQEHLLCLMLNGARELIGTNVVSIGLVNKTLVHPREVFADPIKNRACGIIIAHNHPSGNVNPSEDDIDVTMNLKRAGQILGIELVDHIIFSMDNYFSMSEEGLL